MSASITVLYFAWLRERIGTAEQTVTIPEGGMSVSDLVGALAASSPGHAAAFQNRGTVRCAVNQEFADPSAVVRSGDEVAFFPPVTGG